MLSGRPDYARHLVGERHGSLVVTAAPFGIERQVRNRSRERRALAAFSQPAAPNVLRESAGFERHPDRKCLDIISNGGGRFPCSAAGKHC